MFSWKTCEIIALIYILGLTVTHVRQQIFNFLKSPLEKFYYTEFCPRLITIFCLKWQSHQKVVEKKVWGVSLGPK
jgi:hypothetical protein